MAECIILKGGGGADLDVVTAGRPDVLTGKVIVDKNGEPLTGTMPHLTNESAITHVAGNSTKVVLGNAAFVSKNTDGVTRAEIRYSGDAGYIAPNTLFGIEQEKMAAAGGLTADKMLSNKQAFGIAGSIPLQNADVSGTDRAWSQGMSNWAGTINLRVRNGHYLNGVNWIQQDIPNFRPEYIKRGVDIGGIVGTFEGYVPIPTDLYLRGINVANWALVPGAGRIIFDAGQITFTGAIKSDLIYTYMNLSGYSYIHMELYTPTRYTVMLSVGDTNYFSDYIAYSINQDYGNIVMSIPVSNINASRYIRIASGENKGTNFYVYRVWVT